MALEHTIRTSIPDNIRVVIPTIIEYLVAEDGSNVVKHKGQLLYIIPDGDMVENVHKITSHHVNVSCKSDDIFMADWKNPRRVVKLGSKEFIMTRLSTRCSNYCGLLKSDTSIYALVLSSSIALVDLSWNKVILGRKGMRYAFRVAVLPLDNSIYISSYKSETSGGTLSEFVDNISGELKGLPRRHYQRFDLDTDTMIDTAGGGYWMAPLVNRVDIPHIVLSGTTTVDYNVYASYVEPLTTIYLIEPEDKKRVNEKVFTIIIPGVVHFMNKYSHLVLVTQDRHIRIRYSILLDLAKETSSTITNADYVDHS